MISEYANQSLTWKTAGTLNDYNEPTYSTGTTIKGRKEINNKLIRDAQGQEVVAGSFIVTASAVAVGDKIDDKLVLRSEPLPDLDGTTQFYEVYTV